MYNLSIYANIFVIFYAFSEKNPNNISKEDYQKLYKTAKNNVKLKECENLSLKQEVGLNNINKYLFLRGCLYNICFLSQIHEQHR